MIGRGLLVFRRRRGLVTIPKSRAEGVKTRLVLEPKGRILLVRVSRSPGTVFRANLPGLFPKRGRTR
ncbi:hypothetical protein AXF42_Ash008797 [Apostasia shenzhenica]|uniref:Uncharacterized protein n=1 Tax=Apostasia shenzhenica TaxID=1088818 RepID=A0A2I0ASI6_9ASPA|nr:hypothetical protein AXF42_Ash008797 [Apostasia shenzhenica]